MYHRSKARIMKKYGCGKIVINEKIIEWHANISFLVGNLLMYFQKLQRISSSQVE